MNIKLIISCFIFLFFAFGSCNQINHKSHKSKKEETSATKEEKLKDRFINKKIESINTIISDGKDSNETKIILIYTGFDCQSCVDKGYHILKTLRSQDVSKKILVISSNTNIGRDQERNEFYDFVYNDDKELVRHELKFLITPIILVLNNDNRILHINFPETNSNEKILVDQIMKAS